MPFTKDKYFSAARVLQCIKSEQWHILFVLQFIWIAVPYLLKLAAEWCSGDVLSPAHGCSCVCCRWLQWNMGGASQHLFCFPHIIVLVYCCSIIFDYIKLLGIIRIASAAVHLKPAWSSWEKWAARWTTKEYLRWQVVGRRCTTALPWWSLSIPLLLLNWWDSWEMLLNLRFLVVPSEKKRNCKTVIKLHFSYIFCWYLRQETSAVSLLLPAFSAWWEHLRWTCMTGSGYVVFRLGASFGKVLPNLLKFGIWLLHTAAPTAHTDLLIKWRKLVFINAWHIFELKSNWQWGLRESFKL